MGYEGMLVHAQELISAPHEMETNNKVLFNQQ